MSPRDRQPSAASGPEARAHAPRTRRDFHEADGVLLVVRDPPPAPPPAPGQPAIVPGNPAEGVEILVAVWDDGSVTALHGHVDLGTGIRTALAQIVAEELDVTLDQVAMVLGNTAAAPNQGATIASASIQVHAVPLRLAAAQARGWLLAQASRWLELPVDALAVEAGLVQARGEPSRCVAFGDLVRGRHVELRLDPGTPIKSPADYRLVGTPVPRVDIPAKAAGELTFVHDMRVPGMLHGRVVRPPYAGADHGEFIGNTLESIDEGSIAHVPGIVAVVRIRDFVGVVAEREEQAEQAMRELRVAWKPWPGLPGMGDPAGALRANPSTPRVVAERGDVEAALGQAAAPMARTYVWPYQLHASIGPSCALADWRGDAMTVWAGTQNPHVLRADLAKLTGLPDTAIEVVRMEAAGCYGRNCADDVAADAALLARAVGRPVRVQLTREQEHAWEPKGAAQLMEVAGGLDADGVPLAYDFHASYPSNGAPTLALLLTRTIEPAALAYQMGDRTSVPPYDYQNLRVTIHDMAPMLRASWLRGVSALPNAFAHESFVDELATEAGTDPVEFRLRLLKDTRAAELVRATADRAGWVPHAAPRLKPADGDWLRGQGFAYARYVHGRFPGVGAAWAAWVADVEVNRVTGDVHVSRVVVGHDAGLMVNPAGVRHQVHGNVVQTTSRALKEQVQRDPASGAVASREWGSYPILSFREVPVIEVMMMPRPGEPPQGAGESSSVPGTAAIANAIFDATGVRFRQPPFTPEVVLAGLASLTAPPGAEDSMAPAHLPASPGLPSTTSNSSSTSSGPPSASLESPPALPGASSNQPRSPSDGHRTRPGAVPKTWWRTALAFAAGVASVGAAALGFRAGIAPIDPPSVSPYSAETIERGRQLAALGDCLVCHTAPGGTAGAGGRALDTPFGTVHSTNLTPDPDTGIGRWSLAAFQRAMREGISRDGSHLYPAFPYTAYTRVTDEDLTALYAYLMAQPAVRAEPPRTRLSFPFGWRPLMAAWNALFLQPGPVAADPSRSALWNRGAYLVDGLGHCGACHTPRNALGAERGGRAYLAGAYVDGWEAPALNGAHSRAPMPWTEDDLYSYLRHGYSDRHGAAAGPMAPVIRELAAVPDADVRAMAHYLATLGAPDAAGAGGDRRDPNAAAGSHPAAGTGLTPSAPHEATALSRSLQASASSGRPGLDKAGHRFFESACGACHHDGSGPAVFGRNIPLSSSTKLHANRPDNLVRLLLDGLQEPVAPGIGFMPAFRHSLDDRQIAQLAHYLRERFAPDKAPWSNLESEVARLRAGRPMD